MSFDGLMIHQLVAVRRVTSDDEADLDESGHETVIDEVTTAFWGRVYSKNAREIAQSTQDGASISDHVIRTRNLDLLGIDYITYADPGNPSQVHPTDLRRYEVQAVHIRNDRRGPHHASIEAQLITASPGSIPVEAAS
ncbi:MAG TPA: hypothetical protein VI341_13560 [Actinomycetota bacterium]